jgi:hypothetical protein
MYCRGPGGILVESCGNVPTLHVPPWFEDRRQQRRPHISGRKAGYNSYRAQSRWQNEPIWRNASNRASILVFILVTAPAVAQGPAESSQSVATMKQLMLDLIHPASNDILLFVYRGGSKDETDWVAVRRGALTLAESGNLLMTRGYARDSSEWAKDARLLVDAGTAAYKAAQAKDVNALAALTGRIDAACTTCHRQFRPNVFPREGDSK